MAINPKDGVLKTHEIEVHLHPTEDGTTAVSPNNAAFMVSTVHPLVPFFLVAVYETSHRMEMVVAQ